MAALELIKGRKGIFFTFIAITIIAVFILVYTPSANITLQKGTESVKSRIEIINRYVDELEDEYLETVLRASAHKAILSLIYYINSSSPPQYLSNFDTAFYEVIVQGNINNVPIDSITGRKIMDNNTLTNWTTRINHTAKDTYNVNTWIRINNVSASQSKPWTVDVYLNLNLTIQSEVANWEKGNVTIRTSVDIEGFHDPYYIVNTNRQYSPKIKKSSVEFNRWNLTYAREHIRNATYVHWQDSEAPNFLMRFTNNIVASNCCGIESLVNPNMIAVADQRESYADYLFWTHAYNSQCPLLYNITKPPTNIGLWDEFKYFKLDFDHVVKYNVTDEYVKGTCS